MKQMRNVALVVFLSLPLVANAADAPAAATTNHTTGTPAATTADTTVRPDANNELKPETEVKDLAKFLSAFTKPEKLENLVKTRWGKSGAEALDKVNKPEVSTRDEAPIAKIMAVIVGTKDNDLIAGMIPQIEELKKDAEKAVAPKQEVDKRRLELTKRMLWTVKYVNGEKVKTEEAEKFNKELCSETKVVDGKTSCTAGPLKDVLDKNKALETIANDATGEGGDKPERQAELTKLVNHEAFGSFLANAAKSGNKAVQDFAAKIAQGMSTKDASGNRVANFTGPNGVVPLNLGKTLDDAKKAIKDNAEKLANWVFNPGPAVAAAAPAGQPAAGQESNRNPNQNPPPATSGAPTQAQVQAFATANCLGCHSGNGDAPKMVITSNTAAPFTVDGEVKTFTQAMNAMAASQSMMNVNAKPGVRAQLAAWAAATSATAAR